MNDFEVELRVILRRKGESVQSARHVEAIDCGDDHDAAMNAFLYYCNGLDTLRLAADECVDFAPPLR